MVYYINNIKVDIRRFWAFFDEDIIKEAQNSLDSMLNTIYKDFCIEDLTLAAADILKTMNPEKYEEMRKSRYDYLIKNYVGSVNSGKLTRINGNDYIMTIEDEY